ncbi:MAG: hypothetical protein JXQ27_08600, partial [Acidobacteria bacterium]|nr:hypothetical protein [Acidobacteriota bacterium]
MRFGGYIRPTRHVACAPAGSGENAAHLTFYSRPGRQRVLKHLLMLRPRRQRIFKPVPDLR